MWICFYPLLKKKNDSQGPNFSRPAVGDAFREDMELHLLELWKKTDDGLETNQLDFHLVFMAV